MLEKGEGGGGDKVILLTRCLELHGSSFFFLATRTGQTRVGSLYKIHKQSPSALIIRPRSLSPVVSIPQTIIFSDEFNKSETKRENKPELKWRKRIQQAVKACCGSWLGLILDATSRESRLRVFPYCAEGLPIVAVRSNSLGQNQTRTNCSEAELRNSNEETARGECLPQACRSHVLASEIGN